MLFRSGDGSATPIVLAQDFVVGQGDGWTVVTDFLKRELETLLLNPDAAGPGPYALYEAFLVGIATLGRRIAELHAALARGRTVAFAPEAMPEGYFRDLGSAIAAQIDAALATLARAAVDDRTQADVNLLIASRQEIGRAHV